MPIWPCNDDFLRSGERTMGAYPELGGANPLIVRCRTLVKRRCLHFECSLLSNVNFSLSPSLPWQYEVSISGLTHNPHYAIVCSRKSKFLLVIGTDGHNMNPAKKSLSRFDIMSTCNRHKNTESWRKEIADVLIACNSMPFRRKGQILTNCCCIGDWANDNFDVWTH